MPLYEVIRNAVSFCGYKIYRIELQNMFYISVFKNIVDLKTEFGHSFTQ